MSLAERLGFLVSLRRTETLQVPNFQDEHEEVRWLVMNNVRRRQLSREELQRVIAYWPKGWPAPLRHMRSAARR